MDRRKALKNMGLSLGYAVATPTLISIMQSCKDTAPELEWTPDFFTKDEGSILTHLVDLILPKTDTPSASEVQVNLFIDKFINEVMEKEQQDFVKMTMGEDLEPPLATALKVSKPQEALNQQALEEYMEASKEGDPGDLNDELAAYAFASQLRGMTVWGYKTSEYVGKKVLAYLPLPGEYIGCGDVETLTGGKAWSE